MLQDVDATGPVHVRSSQSDGNIHPVIFLVASGCVVWYCALLLVVGLGHLQLWRYFTSTNPPPKSSSSPTSPRISVIRPVKGIEPYLYECLASTFHQEYDSQKLDIYFCVSDPEDAAIPVLQKLVEDFPRFNARIMIEEEDEELKTLQLGPNPKIRNMSRAFREATGECIWIIDCNVWVARGTLGRMVDTLKGKDEVPAKFVHLLPLTVDVTNEWSKARDPLVPVNGHGGPMERGAEVESRGLGKHSHPAFDAWHHGGGRMDEAFMASAHGKFYTAINTVLIAPCIVGKSTMFRKAHLNGLTDGKGIDFFSENICEDHLIGDLLWKRKVPEQLAGERWANHAMVFGDLAVQPIADMAVTEYWARRVRWLRVRKFTVTLATLVEPGTECFLSTLYGAFGFSTLSLIPRTWSAFWIFWIIGVALWCSFDRLLYTMLHSSRSIEQDENTPTFARWPTTQSRRPFVEWLYSWLGRESLAFPIWAWAVFGGVTVSWRGKDFWVGLDMKVHEVVPNAKRRRD